jgi:hypothetical protein
LAGRGVTAIGDALVYSALIKATAIHFPKQRFALMMSVAQLAGYAGTALAATPLLLLATRYGLAGTYLSITGLLSVIFALVITQMPATSATQSAERTSMSARQILLACRPTLIAFTAYYVAYMTVFATWGLAFLSGGFLLDPYAASSAVLLGVCGLALGGFSNGALLAREWEARGLMVTYAIMATITFGVMLVLAWAGSATPAFVAPCLGLIGFCFGGISNGLTATVRERVHTADLSFASSVHAVLANLAAAVVMPLIGGHLARPPGELQFLFLGLEVGCLIVVGACAFQMLMPSKARLATKPQGFST